MELFRDKRTEWALKTASILLFGTFAVATFRDADLGRVFDIVRRIGLGATLLFVPFAISLALDTAGWRAILARIGRPVEFLRLFEIRISIEALAMSAFGA